VPDPIVGGTVQRASNTPMAVLADHFTAAEWARYAQDGAAAGMLRLRRHLGGRLVVWALLFCSFVAADVAVAVLASRAASETLLQITGILLVLFVVGVPLDALRFQAAGGGVEGMATSMEPATSLRTSKTSLSAVSGSSAVSDKSSSQIWSSEL